MTNPLQREDTSEDGSRWVLVALPVAIVAISFAAIFFRKASPTHPLVAAGLRLAVAAILLAPRTVSRLLSRRLARDVVLSGVLAGVFYSVHFGAWVSSLSLTTVAASVTLVTATPLLLAGHAAITRRDRPGKALWSAIGLAAVGVTIIGGHDLSVSADALIGDALALAGAAAMAGYMVLARRLGPSLDVWAFSGMATSVGAVLLLGVAVAAGLSPLPPSAAAFGWIALSALVPQLVGHNLLTYCLRYARPTVVGMSTVGEPVGATILGFFWLHETVSPTVALGCAITLASVVLALRATVRP